MPWAKAGEVTIANGGDIAKEFGILPAGAATPVAAAQVIVAPFGVSLPLTTAQVAAVQAAAALVRPALVYVGVTTTDGQQQFGSGEVIDPNGLIMTAAHVVAGAAQIGVALPDGRTVQAQVVGTDALVDVAVLRVPVQGLPAVARGSAADLHQFDLIGALGYTDYYPTPPALRAGQVLDLQPELFGSTPVTRLVDDLATLPGDSGGAVFNLQGRLVGLIQAGSFITVNGSQVQLGYEAGIDGLLPVIQQIVATGRNIIHTVLAIDAETFSPDLAARAKLPFVPGIIVVDVSSGSPAEAAGIGPGDVITSVDGVATPTTTAYTAVVSRHQPGDRVRVTFVDTAGARHAVVIALVGE